MSTLWLVNGENLVPSPNGTCVSLGVDIFLIFINSLYEGWNENLKVHHSYINKDYINIFWRTQYSFWSSESKHNDQEQWFHFLHFYFIWKAWEARVDCKHVSKMRVCYVHTFHCKNSIYPLCPLYRLMSNYSHHVLLVVINKYLSVYHSVYLERHKMHSAWSIKITFSLSWS